MQRRTPVRRRSRRRSPPPESDFVSFIHKFLDILFLPMTFPLRVLRDLLTSPLTISVILKAALLVLLIMASALVSVAAVGAFWWSWGTGGNVELEGWLVYGSREHRTPHATLTLPVDRFQEDLAYDVQVELELVRPHAGSEEMGNFMVVVELRSLRAKDVTVLRASQPSLPPPPLPSSILSFPSFPSWLMPPCIIPWPLRRLCPSRLLGYGGNPSAKIKERRRKGTLVSPARGKEVVLVTKELIEGVVLRPVTGDTIGYAFVSIGRDDTQENGSRYREVRTTGWVVVRFVPHPTGLRWLLTANPIPPLLILPPLSLTLTLTSAIIGFIVISCLGRSKKTKRIQPSTPKKDDVDVKVKQETYDLPLENAAERAWADVDRRRRIEAERRRSSTPSDTATQRRSRNHDTSVTVTPTETPTESGTHAESVTETEETWDESESWESGTEGQR